MIKVVENWFEDPKKERETALSSQYKDIDHNGLMYRGICKQTDDQGFQKIEEATGQKIPKRECMYRRYLPEYKNETFIHNDVLIATFTCIVFLTQPEHCNGGLAFWKHALLGWQSQPVKEDADRYGIGDEYWKLVYQDGFDEKKWEMTEYIPMGFNRAVIFWGPMFHSRYPQAPIGTEFNDCRLIKTYFGMVGDDGSKSV